MKKMLLILTAAFAVHSVNAASLQWGLPEDALLYVKQGETLTMANSYQKDTTGWQYVLVYLGTENTLSLDKVSDATVVDSMEYGVYVDGGDAYLQNFVENFETTGTATAKDNSVITISAGDYFGIAFYNGNNYSYVFSTDGSTVGSPLTDSVSLPSLGATANLVIKEFGTGSNVAVPEPSTAALALAGLALLLKRRKA